MSSTPATRRPTIKDVGRLAGVSHQTVSRYLRYDHTVGDALRERIEQAIAQLDYRPNLVARAMRDGRTGRLALVMPTGIAMSALRTISGAAEEAFHAGFVIEVIALSAADLQGARVIELADSGLFEGILSLVALDEPPRRSVQRRPIVISPIYDRQLHSIGRLAAASEIGTIIETLADLGHRRFLHLAGNYAQVSAQRRRQVYLDTIERLRLHSVGIIDCDWIGHRAFQAIDSLPGDTGVTAVIAGNDVLAAGAIRAAIGRGWQVPGDLSVTGWDNNALGALMVPSLTTVNVDHHQIGRLAVRQLIATIRGEPTPQASDEGLTEIIWRESTAVAPGHPD